MTLAHITLATRDVQQSLSFFTQCFNWRPLNRPGNIECQAAWLAIGPHQELHLVEVKSFNPSPFESEFGRHIAIEFPDGQFDELKKRITDHGGELVAPQRETPFERFFFRDLNGYLFEVVDSNRVPESTPSP